MRNFLFGLLVLVFTLNSNQSFAVTATVSNTFSAGQKIVASQLNTNFNDILSAVNGLLSSENIIDGGIATADIADLAITNAKIATATIANVKLATSNYASSTGVSYSNTGITATPITSKTITSVGRPVRVELVNSHGYLCVGGSTNEKLAVGTLTGGVGVIELLKNSATMTSTVISNATSFTCPQAFDYVDSGAAAGSITYELRGWSTAGQTLTLCNCALFVREL